MEPISNDPTSPFTPEVKAAPTSRMNHHLTILTILTVVLFLASSALAAYFYLQTQSLQSQLSQDTYPETRNSQPATPTPITDPTADWKTYINTKYNYEIKYPYSLRTQILDDDVKNLESTATTKSFYLYDPTNYKTDSDRYVSIYVHETEPVYTEFTSEKSIFNGLPIIKAVTPSTITLDMFYGIKLNQNPDKPSRSNYQITGSG